MTTFTAALDAIEHAIEACAKYAEDYARGRSRAGWGWAQNAACTAELLAVARNELLRDPNAPDDAEEKA